jgi:hypothetical protein
MGPVRSVLVIAAVFLFFLTPSTTCGEVTYVEITANGVNLRAGPSTTAPVVGSAWKGDIFELQEKEGRWYKIKMFSVEGRYVHKSLAKATDYAVDLPNQIPIRRKIFRALMAAEDRAELKADRRYPLQDKAGRPLSGNVKRNIDYMWLLNDQYKLEVFQRFRVHPPIYDLLMREGIRKNW